MSKQIASALKTKLTPEEESRIDKKPTDNITAYQYYLKGREYYYRYHKEDNETAISLFKQALELDPNYALAYAGLGDCYGQRVQKFDFPEEWNDSAIAVSNKSISIDPNLAEGYKALALVQFNKGWMKRALETNQKAIKINPSYWPAVGNTGVGYEMLGDLADAVYWDKKGNQLNPTFGFGYATLGRAYLLLLDYQMTEENLNTALNLQPDLIMAHEEFCQLHFNQGKYDEVIEDYDKVMALSSDDAPTLAYAGLAWINLGNYDKAKEALQKISVNDYSRVYANIYLAYIAKKKGNMDEAKNLLQTSAKKLQNYFSDGDENNLDAIHMFLLELVDDNKAEAYQWLNKAVNFGFRDFKFLLNNPLTKDIRNEKQFTDIIQQLKSKVEEQQNILASMNNNQ